MNRRRILLAVIGMAFLVALRLPYPVLPGIFAQTLEEPMAVAVSISELTEQAKKLDGATVIITGEAIAPPMIRGSMAWVNIEDSSGAVGVWISVQDLRRVSYFGSYAASGDTLRIVGTFNRTCSSHGGDLDVHALSISILQAGQNRKHFLTPFRIVISIILSGCSLAVLGLSLIRTVRTRVAERQEKEGNHVRL